MSASATSTLCEYTYNELSGTNTLRLLKVRPAEGSQTEIDCELLETPFVEKSSKVQGSPRAPEAEIQTYEAVSWCWGKEKRERLLRIHHGDEAFSFKVTSNLAAALRALRPRDRARYLWIDAICIDQKNFKERNEQVPRMNKIYGQAKSVCIWIGEADDTSPLAFEFIQKKVLNLWDFDDLCKDPDMSSRWDALWRLMQRPWFSRRWVVQEIGLANEGRLHCGKDSMDWHEFADAVSLFVEVESGTHHLSTVMRRDHKFGNIHNFFGQVPELGAALLIDATSNLFRSSKTGGKEPLLTLEYLVSKYTVFEATQPRDTIYALVAIASDTIPETAKFTLPQLRSDEEARKVPPEVQFQLRALGKRKIRSGEFRVDYKLPVVDVYKDFVEFSIRRSDPIRSLDIICRPWAPRFRKSDNQAGFHEALDGNLDFRPRNPTSRPDEELEDDCEISLPSWISDQSEKAFVMTPISGHRTAGLRMERIKADPLVGLPGIGHRNYSAAGSVGLSKDRIGFKKGKNSYSMFVEGFVLDEVERVERPAQLGSIPASWLAAAGWVDTKRDPPQEFWRTLVANRGPNGRNPLTFYPRACKEAVKSLLYGDTLDTRKLIEEGGSSIVAEFLRRVQAVIWGRSLMVTKEKRLGLVHESTAEGNYVCILYGCSVPVVLAKVRKTTADLAEYRAEERQEFSRRQKNAVMLLEEMRKQQLESRRTDARWLRRVRLSRYGTYLKITWLVAVASYITLWRRAPIEVVMLLVCLIITSPKELSVLTPRLPTRERNLWLWLPKHPSYARVMFLVLFGFYLYQHEQVASELVYVVASTSVLFPRLILVPLGLQIELTMSRFSVSLKRNVKVQRNGWIQPLISKVRSLKHILLSPSTWKTVATSSLRGWWAKDSSMGNRESDMSDEFYWSLVSACYVHGMMDGEAIKWRNDMRKPRQVFELR